MKKNLLVVGLTTFVLFSCGSDSEPTDQTVIVNTESELPLREVKDLSHFVELIKADSAWMVLMDTKSKESGIAIEEVINMDAKFLQDQEVQIVQIENDIIKNPEWMTLVKQKSQEQGITIDEVIRADASFMFKQRQEELKTAQ